MIAQACVSASQVEIYHYVALKVLEGSPLCPSLDGDYLLSLLLTHNLPVSVNQNLHINALHSLSRFLHRSTDIHYNWKVANISGRGRWKELMRKTDKGVKSNDEVKERLCYLIP